MFIKSLNFILMAFFVLSCASKTPQTPIATFPEPVEKAPPEHELNIDYEGLEAFLRLDRPSEKLGYVEKSFSTCEVGYGYPSNQNCRRDYFISIHFQLFCRETDEEIYTEALRASDMRPLGGEMARWNLENKSGSINLDHDGYGQIKITHRQSLKSKRLKISIGNENLYVKAGEMSKIVTPSNWCH